MTSPHSTVVYATMNMPVCHTNACAKIWINSFPPSLPCCCLKSDRALLQLKKYTLGKSCYCLNSRDKIILYFVQYFSNEEALKVSEEKKKVIYMLALAIRTMLILSYALFFHFKAQCTQLNGSKYCRYLIPTS